MLGRKECDPINGCGKIYDQAFKKCPFCGVPEAFSNFLPFNPLDWIYDLETYPNVFTAAFKHPATGERKLFEISERKNELQALVEFLFDLKSHGSRTVGFNNVGFDYPIIHFIMDNYYLGITIDDIYAKAQSIINTPWNNRFDNVIWDNECHIQQIDLYKIHHFDNDSKSTSLKMLEFNMGAWTIQDLPFPPGTHLTPEQIPELINYNVYGDVDNTEQFYFESIKLIEFREQLGKKYDRNLLNHNDTKIGKDYFISEMEKASPGSCYIKVPGVSRSPRQTIRPSINLRDVIFPYINFEQPEFNRVKNYLSNQIITETKGVFKDLNAVVEGFKYDFGAGGIHGSIDPCTVESDETHIIYDWDVKSFYPALAIVNKLHPEHLGTIFCDIYGRQFDERALYKKGTLENAVLKLALNGVFGDTNSKFSPLYDPQYTMSITINGQLLLCRLAEQIIKIPDLQMIQINTDGLTVKCPRGYVDHMKNICAWWENHTQLTLEHAIYKRMFIRDVNNYIGEYEDGKLKSKGAYAHLTRMSEGTQWHPDRCIDWHQNHSQLVVPKAAEAALVHGASIEEFIINHHNIMDFMLRTKVNRSDKLMYTDNVADPYEEELQRITRYYISKQGGSLTKISAPAKGASVGAWKRANSLTDSFYKDVINQIKQTNVTNFKPWELDSNNLPWDERINTKNKSKYEIRKTSLQAGQIVTPCNDITTAVRSNINYDYYIAEAHKLVDPLL